MSSKLKWNLIIIAIVLALWFVAYTLPRLIWGTGLDMIELPF